jgi:hypothetical protein
MSTKRKTPPKPKPNPIPAAKLLRAEAARLDVLKHALPDEAQAWTEAQVWAYELAAAWLESLGAPERIQGYEPAKHPVRP